MPHAPPPPTPRLLALCSRTHQITVEDPVEISYARNVAIMHIVAGVVGLFFCLTSWASYIFILGVVPSSMVACCCKQRAMFRVWSFIGLLLIVLHAILAGELLNRSVNYYVFNPTLCAVIQIALCFIGVIVVHSGCRAASVMRDRTLPHHHSSQVIGQAGASVQVPGHLVHEVQLSQVATQQQC